MAGYHHGSGSGRWMSGRDGSVPYGAFAGGRDLDSVLYVARARHEGELVPGKLNTAHRKCYIPWGGKEIPYSGYEVLCGSDYEWILSAGGNVAPRAVPASDGYGREVMYIGRVHHKGTITIGKVHPSHGVCYIPFGGEELSFSNYEILVTRPASYPAFKQVTRQENWVLASHENIPPGCFIGGQDHDSPLYVGRAHYNGDLIPGKVHSFRRVCYIPWGGKEIAISSYEVLQGDHFEWMCSQGGRIPEGAVHGGRTSNGEVLYIGRVDHNQTRTVGKVQPSHNVCYIAYSGSELPFSRYEVLVKRNEFNNVIYESTNEKCVIPNVTWVEARNGSLPSMAFSGGHSHGCTFYVGRAQHGDELIPGKVQGDCFYPWSGMEHRRDEYQVLCGRNLHWTSTSDGKIPNNAVHGGRTSNGEVLFIGRVHHHGHPVIGKVHPSHRVCYIPHGGREYPYQNYEILISNA